MRSSFSSSPSSILVTGIPVHLETISATSSASTSSFSIRLAPLLSASRASSACSSFSSAGRMP